MAVARPSLWLIVVFVCSDGFWQDKSGRSRYADFLLDLRDASLPVLGAQAWNGISQTHSQSVCLSICLSIPACLSVGSGQWAVGSSTPSVWWAFTACRRDRNQASDPLRSFLLRLVFFKTLFKWLITFSSFKPSLSIAWSSERTFASKVLMLLGGPPY